MASRLRRSAGQSAVAAQDVGPYNIAGLDFNQALTWRAGKALPVADLLSRLQKLGGELRSLEQGQIQAKEFRRLAQDLAHSNLLGHKDKGIRAWTLCSIVDILNICAPDAPFNPAQLRDIFKVVNNLLQNLDDPSNAYNAQHVYILNSLTDTKSIVLITDLERSEELITPLFRICFDIVSGASQNASGQELAKSVEFQLRSMLVTIIDEASISQDTIDIILSQFLRVDPRTQQESGLKGKKQDVKDKKQDTLHLKDYPPAYNMAKFVCTTCTEKMTAYVTQYVGTIIMNASAALVEEAPSKQHARKNSEAEDSDGDDESLADLRKAHRLVRELWRACPDVLINVIPQIEAELHADSTALRELATETLGDIIAGVGISGPPPTTALDPGVYPLPSIDEPEPAALATNPLLLPASPKPFGNVHSSAFAAFLGRRIDKSPSVRNAWTIAVSRILLTDAGGIGLSLEDRNTLLSGYAGMLKDLDDKVRQTAVQCMRDFNYHAMMNVLASDGGLSSPGTVLSTLADRVTDKKHNVREDAIMLLGQMWGTASRDIQNGVERVISSIGDAPSRICNAMYVNDLHIHMQLDKSLYESLLPIPFPPIKSSKSDGQKRGKGSSQDSQNVDADYVRVQRILTLVHGLDTRARPVFFGIQKRQVDTSKVMKVFLKACEDYNGGVVDDDATERTLKEQLTKYIQAIAKQYPDTSKATADLWKFVNMHDRRNYQLIRFATGPEHDYRTMSKAIKELTKRIKESSPGVQSIMETMLPLLYRCGLIVYNRSHVPAITEISRTDEAGLADTAHEVLKDISAKNPEVLKTHIQALCKELEEHAPSISKPEAASAADTLKACAAFARKYPTEVPKGRKFMTAMTHFALFSHSARAAKHAVTILLTVSDKMELHAKELISMAVKDCNSSSDYYLSRLATISQICLLAPSAVAAEEDAILEITVTNCLQKNQSPEKKNDPNAWETLPSQETVAKELSMKVMVNRCRSADEKVGQDVFDMLAKSVISVLMKFLENDGEITPTEDTPPAQRNYLRLVAARYILKLCSHQRRCEDLINPQMFIAVALIVINPPNAVRSGFIQKLQKYLSRGSLHARWYTIFFLTAFEPDVELKSRTVAWLKSRVSFHDKQQKQASSDKTTHQTIMENIFTRLLSLLAHHPDYPDPETADFDTELLDFAKYIVFYLQCVATEENISLIFHIAQRVKQTRDNIIGTDEYSDRLYVLSDLSQAIIRNFADLMPAHAKGVNLLQTWPGRVALPTSLFSALPSSSVAQNIASKNYLPEDVALGLERLVRSMVRGSKSKDRAKTNVPERKRKSDSVDPDDSDTEKKTKKLRRSSTLPIRKTPKTNKRKGRDGELTTEQPSRKSARTSAIKNYAESDDSEDDADSAVASSPIKSSKIAAPTKDKVVRNTKVQTATAATESDSEPEEPEKSVEPEAEIVKDQEDINMEERTNGDHETPQPEETEEETEEENAEAEDEPETEGTGEEIGTADDNSSENQDRVDDEDEKMEGTPSPKPRPTRATRTAKAPAKTNGASKLATRAKPVPKSQPKPAPKVVKQKATTPKISKGVAAAAVSKLNAAAGAKGKKSKPISAANAIESPPAAVATRRSARNTKA